MIEDSSSPSSFLIAGLGNPGRRFREDRHNIGFMVLDRLAASCDLRFSRKQQNALVTDGLIGGPSGHRRQGGGDAPHTNEKHGT